MRQAAAVGFATESIELTARDADRLEAILNDPAPAVSAALQRAVDRYRASVTDARRRMSPDLQRAAQASWEHNQEGLRYLAGRAD